MLCIAAAGVVTALATTSFTLGWTHSVEHTQWEERWRIENGQLAIVSAKVEGPGAGVGLPEDAVWAGGAWTYTPTLPPMDGLNLAASGATGSGWRLCSAEGRCLALGQEPGPPIRLWAAPACAVGNSPTSAEQPR